MALTPLRIGIDVGGTNTDGVLMQGEKVICFSKKSTTFDVTTGIVSVLDDLRLQSAEYWERVVAVMIGTTHFINAIIEAETRHQLNDCIVLRLCGPSTRSLPPFSDWPRSLCDSFHHPVFCVDGGFQVCGKEELAPLDEAVIEHIANQALDSGISSIAISSPFSTVNPDHENRARAIIQSIFSWNNAVARVTVSHEIGSLGLLERENATILNSALLDLAEATIFAFERALQEAGLQRTRLYLVHNDGTICDTQTSRQFPVMAFSSGATNSVRGAAFLTGVRNAIVFDVGGTSTECALLVDGFPRLSQTEVYVGGVRTNFRMPAVISLALGGGSKIRCSANGQDVTIGPDSVRYKITRKALVFGGETITLSDIAVAAGLTDMGIVQAQANVLDQLSTRLQLPPDQPLSSWVDSIMDNVHQSLQQAVDSVKTSPEPLPILLVGGGSVIISLDRPFEGGAEIQRPPFFGVANAIGAAIAQVGGQIDLVRSLDDSPTMYSEVEQLAMNRCIAAGADPDSIEILRYPDIQLPYIPGNMARIRRRAVGRLILDFNREINVIDAKIPEQSIVPDFHQLQPLIHCTPPEPIHVNTISSVPLLVKSEADLKIDPLRGWILDSLDIEYIIIGQALLGCGGGGSAYLSKLEILRGLQTEGLEFVVVPPEWVADEDLVGSCGALGSPIISLEKLGTGILAQVQALKQSNLPSFSAMAPLESGGSNGVAPFIPAAQLRLPIVDADGMGRAFPEIPMLLWFIFGSPVSPFSLADECGRGAVFYTDSLEKMELLARNACVQFGMMTAVALPPVKGQLLKQYSVPYTLSTSWRIGRAIVNARLSKQSIPQAICHIRGGVLLMEGKIVDLQRLTKGGFNNGRITLEGLGSFTGQAISLEFHNEILIARSLPSNSILATVPDLLTLIHTDTGVPILCEELNFGFRVSLLHLPCHPLWQQPEAFARVSPSAFGFDSIDYVPCSSSYPDQNPLVCYDSSSHTFRLNTAL